MLATSASRPAILSDTMRLVRLEKLSAKMNWPNRVSQFSGCHSAATGGVSVARVSVTTGGSASSAFTLASSCVRSSNGQTAGCFKKLRDAQSSFCPRRCQVTNRAQATWAPSGFLEAVSDPVKGFDHLEIVVHDLELLAQSLDVTIDGA